MKLIKFSIFSKFPTFPIFEALQGSVKRKPKRAKRLLWAILYASVVERKRMCLTVRGVSVVEAVEDLGVGFYSSVA